MGGKLYEYNFICNFFCVCVCLHIRSPEVDTGSHPCSFFHLNPELAEIATRASQLLSS